MNESGQRFHKVGEFFTHFPDDLENIIDLLEAGGYSVCETITGDQVIMKPETYTELENIEFMDDNDDDDCYPDGYRPSGE